MKSFKKIIGLITILVCIAVTILLIINSLHQQAPSISLVKALENSTLIDARNLNVPANQSSLIIEAEQASFIRGENEVNVTVIQAANESTAQLLFEIAKTSYLAQGLVQENITIAGLAGAQFNSPGRPYIILLVKENLLIQSCSFKENLAIDAINTQVKG